MSPSANPYQISGLLAEFADPAVEQAYREHMLPLVVRHLRVALWVWGGLILLFGVPDLQALGWGRDFIILLSCRLLQAGLLFGLAFLLGSKPQWASNGCAVTGLEIFGFFLFLPIYFLRPDIASFTVTVIGLMLLAMFLFVPNRLILTLLAALVGYVLTLACIALKGHGAEIFVGAAFLLMLPVITGFFAAQQLHIVQRKQYAMFNQARQANRELEQEVERRKLLELELSRQATTDPLTGLPNRRQYEMLFRRERERCRRQNTAISVAMADLDSFKALNDELGHDAGDLALKHVARLFQQHLREGDVVGRFGGEEFVIVLPDTGAAEAQLVVERLRSMLEGTPVVLKGQPRCITATFSVSVVQEDESEVAQALRRVDEGLYQGKRAGRNRVMVV
ncbi:GGDEF domain-containing protein [Pseudomonas sp. MYb185]|uniref:GGDEF domain-containing protein n=1 Tax=Pseudomonas sp. MYb185 TaxID=1848729 RepID=UPI001304836C|nr:GGDEF domain-containing protein [Pseudomonas sp. MYb185]